MAFDIIGKLRILDEASKPLRQAMGSMAKFGAAAAGLGTAVSGIAVATDSVKKAMDFESQMSSIKALTNSTDAQMKSIQALALEQGATTKYSALEAAQGIEELLKAGMSLNDVNGGGLNAALNLATAGGLDLAEAAETMATSMNAFKKDGLSAAKTADILAGTANAAATDIRNIGYGIASAGGVADMAGVSFRDLNAAIGLMSNDGLKSGSDAGTSFKSMLMYLQPQTKKATELFEELGIGVGKANKFFENGKLKGLDDVAQLLRDVTKDMTDQERTATFLDMFGTDGVKAATTLYKAGAAGVKKFYDEMSTTTALAVAQEKMNNAAGAVEQFQGAVETLQISALLPTMPLIQKFATEAAKVATDLNKWLDSPQAKAWGNAIKDAFNSARTALEPFWDGLNTGISSWLTFVKANLPTLKPLWGGLLSAVTDLGNAFKKSFPEMVNAVKAAFNDMKPIFPVIGMAIWGLGKSLSLLIPVVTKVISVAIRPATTAIGAVGSAITYLVDNVVKPAIPVISTVFKNVWNEVQPILEGMKAAINAVKNAISDAYKQWQAFTNSDAGQLLSGNFSLGLPKLFGGDGVVQINPSVTTSSGGSGSVGSFSSGISNVPYNRMPAYLHKGERVLTRGQNEEYNEQQNGGGRPVVINFGGVTINNDTDVNVLCGKLAHVLANA